jgi:hypothetical protein
MGAEIAWHRSFDVDPCLSRTEAPLARFTTLLRNERALLLLGVGVYVAIAALAWPATYGGMLAAYLHQIAAIPSALMITLPIAALIVDRAAPLAYLRGPMARRLLRFVGVALVFYAGISAFTTYKLAIPELVPFYADPFLADLDAMLHGGNPGEFAHLVVPEALQNMLGMLYGPIWFVLWFGLLAFVALSEDVALRQRYFWSMALTIALLGTISAVGFSSVGPILYERVYDSDRFARLIGLVNDSAIGEYMNLTSAYLYEAYLAGGPARAGAGISAMPSVHLAIATLNTLMLFRLSRVAGAISAAYALLILIGSVFTGWHYAIDGYFSIAAVILIWAGIAWCQRQITWPAASGDTTVPVPGFATEQSS